VVVATGYVGSRRQARIGARAAGRIDKIAFEEGDRVKCTDLLAELDHKDLDASLAATKASVSRAKAALSEQAIVIEKAKTEKARFELLFKTRSISESEYDENRFAYESAVARKLSLEADLAMVEAQMHQSETLLENMFIRAPFDGTVISKDAEEGESIMPGGMGGTSGRGSVATIADLDHLEITCDVQEGFISRISDSQQADISVDAVPNKKYHGQVRKIIPMGDRAKATIKVKVAITDADDLLFPEMSGTVYFLPSQTVAVTSDEPRYFCNASAVTSDESEKQYVWLVDSEKRAYKIAVTAGEQKDGKIEILSGVTGRERIVVNPEKLQEGTPVKVAD
jgi:RND family efflux transporter MFP subunit